MKIPPIDLNMALDEACRRDFETFSARVFDHLNPRAKNHVNWSTHTLHWHLDLVRRGEVRRLKIAMPPRTGKSIATSVAFVAYMHGLDPRKKFICVSYSQELATKLHNDYRRIIKSDWYKRIFPRTRIDGKDTDDRVELVGGGTRIATSVGGTLTGLGADIIIIDDPLKAGDAMSDAKRNAVNEWFSAACYSRLNDPKSGAIILVSQRLHMNDLFGYLDGPEWTKLTLPAVSQETKDHPISDYNEYCYAKGEVLNPARETLQMLEWRREEMGSDAFSAQYLQQPVPPGGATFKRDWIMRYDQLPTPQKSDEWIQAWDCASKDGLASDYTCCTTWMKRGGVFYLVDVFRERVDFPTLRRQATRLARKYKPRMVLVEDTSVGPALTRELRLADINVRAVNVRDPKTVRAGVQALKFEGGRVYLPRQAPWLRAYEDELLAFPQGHHDDQVDSTCLALAYERGTAKTVTSSYPI